MINKFLDELISLCKRISDESVRSAVLCLFYAERNL